MESQKSYWGKNTIIQPESVISKQFANLKNSFLNVFNSYKYYHKMVRNKYYKL